MKRDISAIGLEAEKGIIKDLPWEAFALVIHLSTGYYLVADMMGHIQAVPNKKAVEESFEDIRNKLKDKSNTVARQEWDDLDIQVIHLPLDEVSSIYLSPYIGAQSLYIKSGILQCAGIPVSQKLVEDFKAYSLHDDFIAEADLLPAIEEIENPSL